MDDQQQHQDDHSEDSLSPSLPHLFPSVKIEPTDYWNPPLIQPVNGVITENYQTYASLETVYPASSFESSDQYFSVINATSGIQTPYSSYSNLQENSDYSVLQPTLYREQDLSMTADEGLGSSPSSFDSSSPPLNQHIVKHEHIPSTSSSSSNYDYISTSTSSSPESLCK